MTKERVTHKREKHGNSVKTKVSCEYISWSHMKQRCLNPKARVYKYYGGRGIKIHETWLNSFTQFLKDVGPKPKPTKLYSLDRIDNNGNYEPGNVRWATRSVQSLNRRQKSDDRQDLYKESNCVVCSKPFMKHSTRPHFYCSTQCNHQARVKRNKTA